MYKDAVRTYICSFISYVSRFQKEYKTACVILGFSPCVNEALGLVGCSAASLGRLWQTFRGKHIDSIFKWQDVH